jgi:ABC-2 type transport system ATP-binding protein
VRRAQGDVAEGHSSLAILAEGLGRDYGATRALAALELRVPAGALVGLLGPNGAGKTTAMLLLATLLAPTRGRARVFGHDVARDRMAVRRRLGLVFQEPSVDGLLTVEENLLFAARLAGLAGAASRHAVAAALDHTGLVGRARQPASQLSGGLRRLADIARATLHRPDLLILDEPTVGLDPEHRDRMWSLLDRERRDRGATILFSTHYLSEAEPADRVVMLARGSVVADAPPGELQAALGDQIAELDGDGADALVARLCAEGRGVTAHRAERGWRVGLRGSRDVAAELAAAPGITRLSVRPPTLEDVYFARTQPDAHR